MQFKGGVDAANTEPDDNAKQQATPISGKQEWNQKTRD